MLTIRLEPEVEARELRKSPDELAGEAIAAWLDLQVWQVREIEAALAEADVGDFASEAEAAAAFRRWGA